MKLPYIKVKQRSEIFYLTRLKASILLDHLNFHYREPYSDLETEKVILKNKKYIEQIEKKGIDLQSSEEGIQRRLQIHRINNIKRYIESNISNFFPNSVLLSADISEIEGFEDKFDEYESKMYGEFEFPNDFLFSIIDGQHRLAGLSMVEKDILEEFEIPIVLLLNVSKPMAAKLFADINGKQRAVNKSLIYDLYSNIDSKEFEQIKLFHTICENFYKNEKSPLYRQIKMLGIGSGAISQAFFIDYAKDAINKSLIKDEDIQTIFNHLFLYFKAFQTTFPNDWPVPMNFNSIEELEEHSFEVLKINKSQLVKTNGFGAILRAFPEINKLSNNNSKEYINIINKLSNKISWIPSEITGTGKAFQNKLYNKIIDIINKKSP